MTTQEIPLIEVGQLGASERTRKLYKDIQDLQAVLAPMVDLNFELDNANNALLNPTPHEKPQADATVKEIADRTTKVVSRMLDFPPSIQQELADMNDHELLDLNRSLRWACAATDDADARFLEDYLAGYHTDLIAMLHNVSVQEVHSILAYTIDDAVSMLESLRPEDRAKYGRIGSLVTHTALMDETSADFVAAPMMAADIDFAAWRIGD